MSTSSKWLMSCSKSKSLKKNTVVSMQLAAKLKKNTFKNSDILPKSIMELFTQMRVVCFTDKIIDSFVCLVEKHWTNV